MRLIPDNLTARIILILILGALMIAGDVALVFTLISDDTSGFLPWFYAVAAILTGLVVIAYVISRQIIKPLNTLRDGARRFSTDIQSAPIPLSGPVEIRETARSFNVMQARIARFVQERMQLIAAISHDLRTPLTRLRLRVESLPDANQRHKALIDIEDMRAMISSTLSFVREENNNETRVKTDLSSLIQTVCSDISDTLGPARFEGPDKITVACKPLALKRALANLTENAVKYGGSASIDLVRNEDNIVIRICDSGPGIPDDELENVYIPFYRLEKSRNRDTGGVGLGLSVAKTLLSSQGARIDLVNNPVKGMCASVTLPLT